MTKPTLRVVGATPPVPSTEDMLRALLTERDRAAALLRQVDAMIDELGPRYITEKYPGAREFVKPDRDRLRRELGA